MYVSSTSAGSPGPADRSAPLGAAVLVALLVAVTGSRALAAQQSAVAERGWAATATAEGVADAPSAFTASRAWLRARAVADSAAARDTRLRVVVSLEGRRLHVLRGADTLRSAAVALAMPRQLSYGGRTWEFATPPGVRAVRSKAKNPVWVPPDWHYAEVAQSQGLHVAPLLRGQRRRLPDGRTLLVRGDRVGLVERGLPFEALPEEEEVIFGDTLYMPPVGTRNRRVLGELGPYRLDLGGGYLIHGNDDESTVEGGTTHGCVRLHNEDVTWLFENVPVGTPVFIY